MDMTRDLSTVEISSLSIFCPYNFRFESPLQTGSSDFRSFDGQVSPSRELDQRRVSADHLFANNDPR
jgi:hypothetical protein